MLHDLQLMGIRKKRQIKNHAKLTSYTVYLIVNGSQTINNNAGKPYSQQVMASDKGK